MDYPFVGRAGLEALLFGPCRACYNAARYPDNNNEKPEYLQ